MEQRANIVIVDDDATNLKVAEKALGEKYKVILLKSGMMLLKYLENHAPDLILLDIKMPDMDGYETLSRLKADEKTSGIPVIFLTSKNDTASEVQGLKLGAVDFIIKPFENEIIMSRVQIHLKLHAYETRLEKLVDEKTAMIEHLQDTMSVSFAELVESRDGTTGGHVKNTTRYMKIFVNFMKEKGYYKDFLTDECVVELFRSAPLHDIGKIGITDDVLRKNSSLDPEEFEYMKSHSTIGGKTFDKIIKETGKTSFLETARNMALYHHEKWDGTGYPEHLKGEQIPLCARMLAIVDVYDALTSRRSYKEPFSHEKAMEIIIEGKGKAFDPQLIDIFLECEDRIKETLDTKTQG